MAENKHRSTDAMTGTACKCGASTSLQWEKGGEEWLSDHVNTHHVDLKERLRAILEMPQGDEREQALAELVR